MPSLGSSINFFRTGVWRVVHNVSAVLHEIVHRAFRHGTCDQDAPSVVNEKGCTRLASGYHVKAVLARRARKRAGSRLCVRLERGCAD